MTNFRDMTGVRKGRLVVLSLHESIYKTVTWMCQCDCGRKAIVRATSLRREGKRGARSCGCLHSPTVRAAFEKEHPKT